MPLTLTVDGKFGSGRLQKGTTFPYGSVTVVVVFVVEDDVAGVDGVVSMGAAADVDAGDDDDNGLSRPRWTMRDFLFLVDVDVDVDGDADAGGLMGDVAVLDRGRDRDRDKAGLDGVLSRDAVDDGLDVADVSGAEADDAGFLLHDG